MLAVGQTTIEELSNPVARVPVPEDHEVVQAFGLCCLHEPFRVRAAVSPGFVRGSVLGQTSPAKGCDIIRLAHGSCYWTADATSAIRSIRAVGALSARNGM